MADAKLSELTALGGASLAAGDELYLNDVSAATSKKITAEQLASAVFTNIGVQTVVPVTGQRMKLYEYFQTLCVSNNAGSYTARLGPTDLAIPLGGTMGFAPNADAVLGGTETGWTRMADGVIAQLSPQVPAKDQTYRLYITRTDTSNGEWLELGSASSVPHVRSTKNGTGTQRALNLGAGANHVNIGTDGVTTVAATTATPAAGSAAACLLFGTTAGFGIYYGSGAPTVSAGQGSLYLRSDGSSASTRLYVNSTGSTTWVNITSAS